MGPEIRVAMVLHLARPLFGPEPQPWRQAFRRRGKDRPIRRVMFHIMLIMDWCQGYRAVRLFFHVELVTAGQ